MKRFRTALCAGVAGVALAAPLAVNLSASPVAGLPAEDPAGGDFAADLAAMYDEIEPEFRPDVRWWLAEGLHTDETLRKNVQQISELGFGAAEILAMPEPGADDALYGWGSQEWTNDTRLVMQEAIERDLGFSLTSGTHWATANLPDTYDWQGAAFDADSKAASKELDYTTVLLEASEQYDAALPKPVSTTPAGAEEQVLQGVVAAKVTTPRPGSGEDGQFKEGTGTGQLDLDSIVDLTDQIVVSGEDHVLDWTAPDDGQYALFTYWMHGTAQTAEPSSATNYTINYVDHHGVDALKDYWEQEVLTPEMKEEIRASGRGEIYMDSLELTTRGAGGMVWGYDFKQEFEQRRGYDVTPYLPFIAWDSTRVQAGLPKPFDYQVADDADRAQVRKIRNDVYQTFSEMYEENVLAPLQEWLHSLNMELRAEPSYGTVFEISTPAKYIDGIETESFALNADPDLFRGMLGSANMYGRTFSSETGAISKRNYYYGMDYFTQLAYLQFAGGVNRTVFHGYSAIEGSEEATYWPGHEGMYARFADRFDGRQPASIHYADWTEMLGRNQKILRQGQPQRDIAILRTDNAFVNYGLSSSDPSYPSENGFAMQDKSYFWRDLSLQHAGYTYDYFSPQLLEDEDNVEWTGDTLQPNGPSYKAVILYQDTLELSSAKRLLEIAQDGLPVVFVNGASEFQTYAGPDLQYAEAASTTRSFGDSDAELAQVVGQIKALPNVRTVEGEDQAMPALREMQVEPRVAYDEANNKLLTISRLDKEENVLYTYAYSFKAEKDKGQPATTFGLALEAEGKPYTIDDWTGAVDEVGTYDVADGRTNVQLTLKPGEAAVVALDLDAPTSGVHAVSTTADDVVLSEGDAAVRATKSGTYTTELSDGTVTSTDVTVPAEIPLSTWDVEVEDWNEGERVVATESKFGHTTTEAHYTTKKTTLSFPDSELAAWKDLPATSEQLATLAGPNPSMAHVSGVGTYRTSFTLPEGWDASNGAYLRIGSTNGGTAKVSVNGQEAPGLDLRSLQVDISPFLKTGANEIEVQVTSTLTNRLLQRDYQSDGASWPALVMKVQDYGMTGDVRVVPYTDVTVCCDDAPGAPVSLGAPTVNGTPAVGATLTATAGTWDPADVSTSVQWLRNGSPIAGATAWSYGPVAADVGAALSVTVTATSAGAQATRTSAATTPVAKAASVVRVKARPQVVRSGRPVKVVVKVRAAVATDGWVRIKTRGITRKVRLDDGKAVVTLRLRGVGKRTVKAVYLGSDVVARDVDRATVRVR